MSVAVDPNTAVNQLADRFWEGVLERDPLLATLQALGDRGRNGVHEQLVSTRLGNLAAHIGVSEQEEHDRQGDH